jgi:hypothetical protein
LFWQKEAKTMAAIIIPPILCTDDSARAARLAAGMHRQKKANKQSRPGGLSWIHSNVPAANEKKQKPLAAIIIPPILYTYDPARAASIAAGMHRQIKAKKQNRPGGLSWIHSDVPPAKEEVIGPFHGKFKSNKKPAKPGQEPTRLSLRIVDRVQNGLRVSQRDKQQDPCGPFRFATPLLPIAECGRADTQ